MKSRTATKSVPGHESEYQTDSDRGQGRPPLSRKGTGYNPVELKNIRLMPQAQQRFARLKVSRPRRRVRLIRFPTSRTTISSSWNATATRYRAFHRISSENVPRSAGRHTGRARITTKSPSAFACPIRSVLEIVEADAVVKGQTCFLVRTSLRNSKPACVFSFVPPFIVVGEKIVVDTNETTYVRRWIRAMPKSVNRFSDHLMLKVKRQIPVRGIRIRCSALLHQPSDRAAPQGGRTLARARFWRTLEFAVSLQGPSDFVPMLSPRRRFEFIANFQSSPHLRFRMDERASSKAPTVRTTGSSIRWTAPRIFSRHSAISRFRSPWLERRPRRFAGIVFQSCEDELSRPRRAWRIFK